MLPLRPFQGALPWPAQGMVIGRFGRQTNSRFGTSIARSGIEISLAEGQPVRAVHEGTVAYADQFTGYGNLVIVDHGDSAYSLYGYLSALEAARGAQVDAQTADRLVGTQPQRQPGALFRASNRRQTGRSLTMVKALNWDNSDSPIRNLQP